MTPQENAARNSFSLYLETSGPGALAQRASERAGQEAVLAARDLWSGRLTSPQTKAETIVAALGLPDVSQDGVLQYALTSRPGYLYVFEFSPGQGFLMWSGFRRAGAMPSFQGDAAAFEQLPARLAALGATATEVRVWLGEPRDISGWWPIENWEYSSGLTLSLRHGVVEVP